VTGIHSAFIVSTVLFLLVRGKEDRMVLAFQPSGTD
jgi:hypothetical protein